MHRSESRPAGIVALTMSVFLVALAILLTAHPAAAEPMTYLVTSDACEGPGSITEAMTSANGNPGEDTISFDADVVVDFRKCPPNPAPPDPNDYFALQATESVVFEGNGAKLFGEMFWVDLSGINRAGQACLDQANGDLIVTLTPGFIKVGVRGEGEANSDITVTVRELDIEGLSAVATIEEDASLVMEDLTVKSIYSSPNEGCLQPAILANTGANFSAYRTGWNDIWNDFTVQAGVVFLGAISSVSSDEGQESGNLTIEESSFTGIRESGVISWAGKDDSEVNIVSSRFADAGGISVDGRVTSNIVNSIWSDFGLQPNPDDRIINFSTGEMNIIASTLLFASVECDRSCQILEQSRGRVLRGFRNDFTNAAKINLIQSAVGVTQPDLGPEYTKLLDPKDPPSTDDNPGFSADEYTWIQPTALQGLNDLIDVTQQSLLLTVPPGLPTFPLVSLNQATRATPLVPGELIDVVKDAVCDENDAHKETALRNPIDDTCITEDALGNPRVDGNNNRNSGAVQLNEAPHLSVAVVGDRTVDVDWTKPRDLEGLCGYRLTYRETGTTNDSSVDIIDPDTLSYQITGLMNGTEYEFEVEGLVNCPDSTPSGFPSNLVTAIPQGPFNVDRNPDESAVATNKENKTRYWENEYGGTCYKYEVGDDYGSVWEITGGDPSALILKSGRTNDVWNTPDPGYYGTVSFKDISHAIVCYDPLPE